MKKTIALALLLPALAHARFEEFVDYETPSASEWTLPFFVFSPIAVWLAIVWERGWLYRSLPLALAAVSGVAWWKWGLEGLGMVAVLSFLLAMLTGAWWACEDDKANKK